MHPVTCGYLLLVHVIKWTNSTLQTTRYLKEDKHLQIKMKEESWSGVVACHVSIRMTLLQRQTLNKIKNHQLKCINAWLFDHWKVLQTVDWGRGICPLFRPHQVVFGNPSVRVPRNLPSKAKNPANAQGLRGLAFWGKGSVGHMGAPGIDWCIILSVYK